MLNGVHHITLRVRDLERSRTFYREVIGLEPDQDFPNEKLRFRIPGTDTRLVLHPPLDGTPADDSFDEHRIGLDHLALAVGTRDDLDTLVERMRAAGVGCDVHADPTGFTIVSFRDPDNIQWEFFEQS